MTISDAMERAEKVIMEMDNDEIESRLFYNKQELAEHLVREIIIAFFQDPNISKSIEETRENA